MEEGKQATGSCCPVLKNPKNALILIGMVLLTSIVIVSILRDRFVSRLNNQVTVMGEGKVSYQPDIAVVTLGVQVDKAPSAENALNQLNDKINNIIPALKAIGIAEEDIQTKNYSLFPQYDFKDGVQNLAGYNANQQLTVKIRNIQQEREMLSKVVSEAGKQGINQVQGISFDISSMNDLRQQARIKAFEDAKAKAKEQAEAAGIKKLGEVVGWYENVKNPGSPIYDGFGGMGGAIMESKAAPEIPSGTQEVVVEIGLNYLVK